MTPASIEEIRALLEISYYLVTLLGIPVAIVLFLMEKKKERKEREYGTYNALDDKYIEFLILCMQNVDLDIYYVSKEENKELTEEQEIRKLIIFEILISILERAYLMYRDQSTKTKREQWEGWNEYMKDWMEKSNFRKAWDQLGHQWEVNFEKHMNELFKASVESSTAEA